MNPSESNTTGSQAVPNLVTLIPQKRSLSISRPKTKVTRACDICKAKKSKCSGEQPCETCSRRDLDCQYETAYFRGRAPVPRRTQRSPIECTPPAALTSVPQPSYQQPHLYQIHVDYAYDRMNPNQEAHADPNQIPEVPSRASPALEVAGQYTDPTSGLSFLHRAWRKMTNKESSHVINGQLSSADEDQLLSCAGDKPLQADGHTILPHMDRCQSLLTLYFDVCIATYRLLHRPTVESWLAIVSDNFEHQRQLFTGIGRAKTATVLSALAVAAFHEEKEHGLGMESPADVNVRRILLNL